MSTEVVPDVAGAAADIVLEPRRYRVVRIMSRLIIGGPVRQVIELAALEPRFPTLLITGGVEPGEHDCIDEVRAHGISVLRLPELGRSVQPGLDLAGIARLTRVLRATRPQIVHTHTAKAGAVGRVAALLAGVPVRVHTFHGHVFHGYFGPAGSRAALVAERALARITTRIIALSERQARELVTDYRIAPASRVSVIPLGLDLDRFAVLDGREREAFRAEVGAAGRPVIVAVGRLAPIKRHDVLLAAFARLRASGTDAVLAFVGGGTEEPALRSAARAAGLNGDVRFLGYRTDLERVYAGSDVVALSSDNEGTPVSLLEALAAGVPVVATEVGGVADVLAEGELGTLVPPRDPDALADALAAVLAEPAMRRPTEAARAQLRTRYGSARLAADMTRLYDELSQRVAR